MISHFKLEQPTDEDANLTTNVDNLTTNVDNSLNYKRLPLQISNGGQTFFFDTGPMAYRRRVHNPKELLGLLKTRTLPNRIECSSTILTPSPNFVILCKRKRVLIQRRNSLSVNSNILIIYFSSS
jgi:hypothetical protein